MASPESIKIETTEAVCDGGGGLGHPRVYLKIGEFGKAYCPYCSACFELAEGAAQAAEH